MNNEKVVALPASVTYTPEQALWSTLNFAQSDNLSDVLVIGYDSEGVLLIRSSRMSRGDALVMLEHARQWAMQP